jgi:hypothetical protein
MIGSFQTVRFVSKQSETTKLMIILIKVPVVSSFHRFAGVLTAHFNSPSTAKLKAGRPSPEKR